ncbi:hypothetical protein Zmor_024720 [Zophobas morio]|uniref:Uncharacterized protein n=1 Tax=Zophobas morio TaxID=2755281 RepID=A0AA38HYZ0_9CUCU|nr:hypothetical protein Zmor_024720 [Zophobas morio]
MNAKNDILQRDKEENVVGGVPEIMNKWKQHFETILNNEGLESFEENLDPARIMTKLQLKEMIEKLKNNKTAGENGIITKLIKKGGLELELRLDKIFRCCNNPSS